MCWSPLFTIPPALPHNGLHSSPLHNGLHSKEAQQVFVLPAVGAEFWGEIDSLCSFGCCWESLSFSVFLFCDLPTLLCKVTRNLLRCHKERLSHFLAMLWELVMLHGNHQIWGEGSDLQAYEQLHTYPQGGLSNFDLCFWVFIFSFLLFFKTQK